MPAYDFRCKSCDHTFEITRAIGESSPVPCPECGGETKRVFSPVGIHFKGSGFHNTDYRRSAASADATSDAPKSDAPCPAASGGGCAGCPAATPE